jgi:hypothetical protein
MNIDRIGWQAKINLKIIHMLKKDSDVQGGRGFFLCPRGQRVGSAPNVHESPR